MLNFQFCRVQAKDKAAILGERFFTVMFDFA